MQSVIITFRPLSKIRKWNQLSQFRKDLSWLHFDDEPGVQEGPFLFVANFHCVDDEFEPYFITLLYWLLSMNCLT